MKFDQRKSQKGAGFIEMIFWAALIAVVVWLFIQYRSNPDTLNSMRATHSPLEDKK
ncbi:MAG TPA: hypothetical protein VIJ93_14195 [bacterium]